MPIVGNAGAHSLDVAIGSGDGNPSGTSYGLQVSPAVGGNMWVQANGSVGSTAVFQTASAWGTRTVTGLADGTHYAFVVVARNGDGVLITPGPAGNGTTLDVTPTVAIFPLDDGYNSGNSGDTILNY